MSQSLTSCKNVEKYSTVRKVSGSTIAVFAKTITRGVIKTVKLTLTSACPVLISTAWFMMRKSKTVTRVKMGILWMLIKTATN